MTTVPRPAPGEPLAVAPFGAAGEVLLDEVALDRLMPLHLTVARDGRIRRAGPTLRRLRPSEPLAGADLFTIFQVRRPRGAATVAELLEADGGRVSLSFRAGPRAAFKGLIVPLPGGQGGLINLSFGISVIDAVREYDLTASDFAPTDLAVEMLYLVEAKSAALHESKKLNLRLQGAKVAAEEQAFTDTLTGLKNRRAMDHVLGRLLAARQPFAVMNLDLDLFKQVNDSYGHGAGDEVLQEVARVLVAETRDVDTVARVGGDEFVLIFAGLDDPRALRDIARRLIARIEVPVPYHGAYCQISCSIGIATSADIVPLTAEHLLQAADTALYASKNDGRGRFTFFRPDGSGGSGGH